MTIISLEGPKGSGKSTLATKLTEKNYDIIKYDANRLMKRSDFQTNSNIVFDRGALSNLIYTFLWSLEPTFTTHHQFNTMTMVAYKPIHFNNLKELIEQVDEYIIFYASNPNDLRIRLEKRKEETGKYASPSELKELTQSNQLFRLYGEFLKEQFPMKVTLIDISNSEQEKQLYQQLGV